MTLFPALAGVLSKCVGYAPSSTSYRDVVEFVDPTALVSYWPLNEAAGATAAVDRGGVQNLAYGGAVAQSLPALTESPGTDTSVDYGGTGYASVAHNAAWALADYTLAFVFVCRIAPASGDNQVLVSKDGDAKPAGRTSIEVYSHSTNGLQLRAYAGGSTPTALWIGSPNGVAPLARGRAHHVCLTVSATDGARLYLDGNQVAADATGTQGWQLNAEALVVAAWTTSAAAKLNGLIQHVALWNRALTAGEVTTLARAATPVIVYGGETITATEGGSQQRVAVLADDVHPAGATVRITQQPSRGSATVDGTTQEIVYTPPVSGTGTFTIDYRVDPGARSGSISGTVAAAAPPPPSTQDPSLDDTPLGTWPSAVVPASGWNPFRHSAHGVGPAAAPAPDPLPSSFTTVTSAAQLQSALAQSSHPNNTIVLREGLYIGRFTVSNGGTASNPLKIRGHPSDDPAKIILADVYAPFATAGNTAWELYDSSRHIWRSGATGFGSGNVFGMWRDSATGRRMRLFPYYSDATFFATTFGRSGYRGPGLRRIDDRLYIRLQNPGSTAAQGVFDLIQGKDPRQHQVFASAASGTASQTLRIEASHVRVWDLTVQGGYTAAMIVGARTNIRFLRTKLYGTSVALGLISGDISNVWVEYCELRNFMPQCFDLGDHKQSDAAIRAVSDTIAVGMPSDGQVRDHIHLRHCRITDWMDAFKFSSSPAKTNLSIRNCYIRVYDDITQHDSRSYNLDYGYNYVHATGWSAHGNSPTSVPFPGRVWIHHNIHDLRYRWLLDYGNPRVTGTVLLTHADYGPGWPVAIYNNTVIGGGRNRGQNHNLDWGMRIQYIKPDRDNTTGVLHYILNNILVQTDWAGEAHMLHDHYTRNNGSGGMEFLDHNLYWFQVQGSGVNLLNRVRVQPSNTGAASYASLNAWRNDATGRLNNTKAYGPHGNGWEANGRQTANGSAGDPFKDFAGGDFRPRIGGPYQGMTRMDLATKSFADLWPDRNSNFVGALAPTS